MAKSAIGELGEKFKLSVRSTAGVFEVLNGMLSRVQTGGVEFRDGKVTKEALVNALILRAGHLTREDLVTEIAAGVRELEELLRSSPAASVQGRPGGRARPAAGAARKKI